LGIAAEDIGKFKARVLYIAPGEPDDRVHQRRYDRYLDYIHVFDDYVEHFWILLRRLDAYRDTTTVTISTERGRGASGDWAEHETELEGSDSIWIGSSPIQVYSTEYF